jgi:hypothetical protein
MKSRRVRRARNAKRQAHTAVETYRLSSRGLTRVFTSILPDGSPSVEAAAARAAHHLAGVEALLPKVREAVRSCRYPGAEHGDPAALVWGLWSQLSETLLHVNGAVQSLEVLGQHYRYREEDEAAARTGRRPRGTASSRSGARRRKRRGGKKGSSSASRRRRRRGA